MELYPHACAMCDRMFTQETGLNQHMDECHSDPSNTTSSSFSSAKSQHSASLPGAANVLSKHYAELARRGRSAASKRRAISQRK